MLTIHQKGKCIHLTEVSGQVAIATVPEHKVVSHKYLQDKDDRKINDRFYRSLSRFLSILFYSNTVFCNMTFVRRGITFH